MKKIRFLITSILSLFFIFSYSQPPEPPDDAKVGTWKDSDNDGYTAKGCSYRVVSGKKYREKYAPLGWDYSYGYTPAGANDCNDNDPNVWRNLALWVDKDGDKFPVGNHVWVCVGNTIPPGYVTDADRGSHKDCNDANAAFSSWITVPWSSFAQCLGPGSIEGDITISPANDKATKADRLTQPSGFALYPNPAFTQFVVTPNTAWNGRIELKLVDPFGRTVKVMNLPSAAKDQGITVNVSTLSPGVYKLIVKRGDLLETKTISIKL